MHTIEVHLRKTNQSGTVTTNLNGHSVKIGSKFTTLVFDEDQGSIRRVKGKRTVFRIPNDNVAYIREEV